MLGNLRLEKILSDILHKNLKIHKYYLQTFFCRKKFSNVSKRRNILKVSLFCIMQNHAGSSHFFEENWKKIWKNSCIILSCTSSLCLLCFLTFSSAAFFSGCKNKLNLLCFVILKEKFVVYKQLNLFKSICLHSK